MFNIPHSPPLRSHHPFLVLAASWSCSPSAARLGPKFNCVSSASLPQVRVACQPHWPGRSYDTLVYFRGSESFSYARTPEDFQDAGPHSPIPHYFRTALSNHQVIPYSEPTSRHTLSSLVARDIASPLLIPGPHITISGQSSHSVPLLDHACSPAILSSKALLRSASLIFIAQVLVLLCSPSCRHSCLLLVVHPQSVLCLLLYLPLRCCFIVQVFSTPSLVIHNNLTLNRRQIEWSPLVPSSPFPAFPPRARVCFPVPRGVKAFANSLLLTDISFCLFGTFLSL